MLAYQLSLYVHLLALVAASATSSVVHLAAARARSAAGVAEARQWHALAGSSARMFPIATLLLFATGAIMVSLHGPWSWSTGWVDAGIAGVVFLLLSVPVLGRRGARAGRALAGLAAGEVEKVRDILHDPLGEALSWANTGVALGVVFAMAAKPSLPAALAAVALGGAAGVGVQLLSARRAGARPSPALLAADDLAA